MEAGYKDARNAKTMFARLKKAKLDGAATGTALPKPTTPTKKPTGGTAAARKGGNGGVLKAKGGGVTKGGRAKNAAKAVVTSAVNGDAEVRDDDEESVMDVKTENGGSDAGKSSELEVGGSGGEVVVKDEYSESTDGQVVIGFTAINDPGVLEADELENAEDEEDV